MKKETIIAIVLGIIAGIGIAGFVIFNSKRAASNSSDVILDNITPTVSLNTDELSPLLITAPEDELVVEESTIELTGSAQVGSLMVVQTPNSEDTFTLEESNFTRHLELLPGENIIKVTSYNQKNIDSRTLEVYYIEK